MAKQKKKRNKRYHGVDARVTTPMVTRVSAEERSRFKEWWLVYGRLAKFAAAVVGIIAVIVLLVIGIIGLF
ncbi:MAG TPA: hypothetical protein PK096_01055 [Candidatus Saccharibacteria bacterium]|nr:hypothetical protein [Candidatus Saccharibacteria bacterium]HRK93937.1 hypothetical protein [Candidatus Saccharibacteria bacterium]